jgi:cytochrome c oxidase subunit 2
MQRRYRLACAAAALAASGCSGVQPIFAPAGPEAATLAHLGWFILITFSAVTAVMWALIFWVAARRRGTLAEHAPDDAPSDQRWIVIGGFLIPALILGVIFAATLRTMAAFPMGDDEMHAAGPMITLVGRQWWWQAHYHVGDNVSQHFDTANEIHIPAGRPVDIRLETSDVIHSFWVPRLHGKVDLVPGFSNRIRIQADQPGVYRGECAEFCGPQHAHMILLVQADAPADFERWLERMRAPGAAPQAAAAVRGQQVFMASACPLCHTVRGTTALGTVGPDLTHIAARQAIASNSFPNSRAYLAAWVTHAQAMKPGAQMPDLTAFSGDDLLALVTYLEELK